jgi:hypothetical protein
MVYLLIRVYNNFLSYKVLSFNITYIRIRVQNAKSKERIRKLCVVLYGLNLFDPVGSEGECVRNRIYKLKNKVSTHERRHIEGI